LKSVGLRRHFPKKKLWRVGRTGKRRLKVERDLPDWQEKRREVVALNRNWIVDYVLPIVLILLGLVVYGLLWGEK
jgi:hypothetical protein